MSSILFRLQNRPIGFLLTVCQYGGVLFPHCAFCCG